MREAILRIKSSVNRVKVQHEPGLCVMMHGRIFWVHPVFDRVLQVSGCLTPGWYGMGRLFRVTGKGVSRHVYLCVYGWGMG